MCRSEILLETLLTIHRDKQSQRSGEGSGARCWEMKGVTGWKGAWVGTASEKVERKRMGQDASPQSVCCDLPTVRSSY